MLTTSKLLTERRAYSPEIDACGTSEGEGEWERTIERFDGLQLERVTDSVCGLIDFYYLHEHESHLILLSSCPSLFVSFLLSVLSLCFTHLHSFFHSPLGYEPRGLVSTIQME